MHVAAFMEFASCKSCSHRYPEGGRGGGGGGGGGGGRRAQVGAGRATWGETRILFGMVTPLLTHLLSPHDPPSIGFGFRI